MTSVTKKWQLDNVETDYRTLATEYLSKKCTGYRDGIEEDTGSILEAYGTEPKATRVLWIDLRMKDAD